MKRLLLIATMALCSMPKIESSFFAKAAATAWKYSGYATNALFIGSSVYYEMCISSLKGQNEILAKKIIEQQNNSTRFAIVTGAALCIGGYVWINHKYKQFLAKRPTICDLIADSKSTEELTAALKKHKYTQKDFINAPKPPKVITKPEMDKIIAALSPDAEQTATQTPTQTAVRPTINAILAATKTTQEAAAELKKHKYTKLELVTTCILTQNIKGKDIQAIEKLLA